MSGLALERVWGMRLADVSLALEPGLAVVIGADSDGASELIELCAGVRRARRGRVRLDGLDPSSSPACRRRIASLLADERDPSGGDVQGWLRQVARRGGAAERAVLDACGIEPARELASLSSAEWRELACAVALAHPDPAYVLLHEPLAASADRPAMIERLTELGKRALVLVTTASIAAARALPAASTFRLDRGLLSPAPGGAWPGSNSPALEARLRIEADAPRALVAALAGHPDVNEIDFDERLAGRLLLRGADLEKLSLAVARAAVDARVEVRLLRVPADDLDAARGAATAVAHAAYRAAQSRLRAGTAGVTAAGSSDAAAAGATGSDAPEGRR